MKIKLYILLALILVPVLCLAACFKTADIPAADPVESPSVTVAPSAIPAKTESELFDEFLDREFIDSVTTDSLTLHQMLKNPKDYGITDYETSWGVC